MGGSDEPPLMNNNTQSDIEQPPFNGSNLPSLASNANQDRTLPLPSSSFLSNVMNRHHSIDRGVELAPLRDDTQARRGSPPEGDHQFAMPEAPMPEAPVDEAPMDEPRVWESPDARNIPTLFPALICPSIVKSDGAASIRAIFTDTPSQCSLEIHLYPTEIPYIAWELFKVHIEIENGQLLVRFEKGANISAETFTLHGADRQATERLLGNVSQIISAGVQYKQEIEWGEPVTRLISLEVEGNAEKPSCLKVLSDEKTISTIAAQLWPAFPHRAV